MNKEFFEAVALMEKEKGIQADYLYDKISEAIVKAVRKDYNNKDVVACDIDPKAMTMRVYVHLNIVEELEDWDTDILVEDALEYRADAKAGETLEIELDDIDAPVELPDFIGIIKDVTNDNRYSNASLARTQKLNII